MIPFPSVGADVALVLLNISILLSLKVLLIFFNLYFPDPLSCKQFFSAAHVLVKNKSCPLTFEPQESYDIY